MREKYEQSATDPELLNLCNVISVYEARLHELMQRVDTGESGALWTAVVKAWSNWQSIKKKDPAKAGAAEAALGRAITKGFMDHAAWKDIFEVFELRRVAVQTESRRRKELQDSITSEQAMAFMAAMTEAVRKYVSDRATLQAIGTEFAGLMRRGRGQGALPA